MLQHTCASFAKTLTQLLYFKIFATHPLSGWGLNDHINNAFSDVLQEVSLSVVSNDKCNRQFEFDLPGLGFNFAI